MVMTAEYENSLDDLVALNGLLDEDRSRGRRQQKVLVFLVGLVLAGWALIWGTPSSSWPLLLFVGAMAAVAFGLGPHLERRALRREVEQAWEESGRHLGAQRLELTHEALVHHSSQGELRRAWVEVDRILLTEDHLFLVWGEQEALVVPARVLGRDALGALAGEAEERWRVSRG